MNVKYQVTIDKTVLKVDQSAHAISINEQLILMKHNGIRGDQHYIQYKFKTHEVEIIEQIGKMCRIKINGKIITMTVKDQLDLMLDKLGMNTKVSSKISSLRAPMPWKIIEILVQSGDQIKKGDPLIILEAMKMENVMKAPADLTIVKITVKVGDNVEKNK